MVENRPWGTLFTHLFLILGVALVVFPVYVAIIASTHAPGTFVRGVIPLLPGTHAIENYTTAMLQGRSQAGTPPIGLMLLNSLVMALAIAFGKIAISILSAFAIVYFRFPFRLFFFWLIFVTLMLPVEVRIVPTFQVVADLGLLNSYAGLSVPLLASATCSEPQSGSPTAKSTDWPKGWTTAPALGWRTGYLTGWPKDSSTARSLD